MPLVKEQRKPQERPRFHRHSFNGSTSGNDGDWYDPWGYPYIVAVDANYNGYVDNGGGATIALLSYTSSSVNYITTSVTGATAALQTGCIAGSFGADHGQGAGGNKNYTGSDDVLSFQ